VSDEALVTVVIPARRRPCGLDALRAQDIPLRVLLLANGGWTGADVPAPGAPGWPVTALPATWRGHGPTRQEALAHVRTPWVLFTVEDAVPQGSGFVRAMLDTLRAGAHEVVTARQVAWADAGRAVRRRLGTWTPAQNTRPRATVDHVAALYRTDALRARPLPPVATAEDWAWAREAPTGAVGYAPTAVVMHSHPRHFGALRARARLEHAVRTRAGHPPQVGSRGALVRALPGALRLGLRTYDLPGTLGELLGQWEGARDALSP
jgi:hypothetical protein